MISKFWKWYKIRDNGRSIVSQYVACRMALIVMTLSNLGGDFRCLKPFYMLYHCLARLFTQVLQSVRGP